MSSPPKEQAQSPSRNSGNAGNVSPLPMVWKADSNQGQRKDNQDRAIVVSPADHQQIAQKGVLLIICDGVGGEQGGDIASTVASTAALKAYYTAPAADPREALEQAISKAQTAVRQEAASKSQYARMATTIVASAVFNGALYVSHVGDSRAYLYRDGQIRQITRDHTFANAQVDSGAMTAEDALRSTYRSTLVRSLGIQGNHQPDSAVEALQPGDRILLCSDGLHGSVDDQQITKILGEQPDPGRAVSNLIAAAIANQSGDNISAAVLNYGMPDIAGVVAGNKTNRPSLPLIGSIAAIVLLSTIGLIWFWGQSNKSDEAIVTSTAIAPTALTAQQANVAVIQPTASLELEATSTRFSPTEMPASTPELTVAVTGTTRSTAEVAVTATLAKLVTTTNTPKPPPPPTRTSTAVPTLPATSTQIPPTDPPKPKPPSDRPAVNPNG